MTDGTDLSSKGARTRRAILDAAIARFGRDGFRSTSVTDIARDASVGGTVAYAYFPNKEALFLAAVDEDAAGVIDASLRGITDAPYLTDWPAQALAAAFEALERHPLAERLLAGLEPEATARVVDIPAIVESRKTLAERLRTEQLAGRVRDDIDPDAMGNGLVSIMLSLLMSMVQLGSAMPMQYADDVTGVLHASITSPLGGSFTPR